MGKDIHSLCTWKKANTEDAVKAFKLGKIFEERDIGADAHVLFGDVPDTYVHREENNALQQRAPSAPTLRAQTQNGKPLRASRFT